MSRDIVDYLEDILQNIDMAQEFRVINEQWRVNPCLGRSRIDFVNPPHPRKGLGAGLQKLWVGIGGYGQTCPYGHLVSFHGAGYT